MTEKQFKVRDLRKKQQFIVDDLYLNGYAKAVSPYATLVYLSLCRHADKGQRAFPSIKRIASEFSISPTSVKKGIKELLSFNLIKKVRLGKRLSNEYWLLDKSNWVMVTAHPSPKKDDGRDATEVKDASQPNNGRETATKDAQGKDTHKKDSASPAANADTPMNLKEFVEWCEKSSQRHIQIIGIWADTTEPNFTTKQQWESFIKRNLRAAKNLEPFEDERLKKAYQELREAAREGWLKKFSLETLYKFVMNHEIK